MPLLDRNRLPPGGFPYREPSLNWKAASPLTSFNLIVTQIQAVRANNPASGLNPSREACADALDAYTCARLNNDPVWCVATETPITRALAVARQPRKCSSCGSRRRKKATAQ